VSSFSWTFFNYFLRFLRDRKGRRHPCSLRWQRGNGSWTYQCESRTFLQFCKPCRATRFAGRISRFWWWCVFRDYSCLHYTGRRPASQAFRKLFFTFFSIEKLHFSPDGIGHYHKRIRRLCKLLATNNLRDSRRRRPPSRWLSVTYGII